MSVFGCHFSMHRFIYLAFAATSILKCITRWRTRRRRTKTTKKQQLAFIRNEESDSSPPSCGLYVEINFQLFPCTHTVRTRPWLMPTIPCPHPFPSFPLRPHCLQEVFAGMAVLCVTSKATGLANSIAVDKIRKRSGYTWPQFSELQIEHGKSDGSQVIPNLCIPMSGQKVFLIFLMMTSAELESPTSCLSMHAFYFCWLPKWESWRPWRIQGTVIFGLHAGSCNSC